MTESSGESREGRWRIELLGGLRATQRNRVIERFRSQKTGVLLAYLAYHCHRTHQREALLEVLWPECEPHSGRQRLSTALSWLRHQLEPPGVPAGVVLIADRAAVGLDPKAITTDVADFQAACSAGLPPGGYADRKVGATTAKQAGSGAEQTELLAQAAALYRG